MKLSKLLTIAIVLILLSVILVGCAAPSPAPEPTVTPLPAPTPASAPTPEPEPTSIQTVTRITIDGQGADWLGRPVLLDDPAGDTEEGFLDLTTGYAFVNQHALYLLVETVDFNAPFVQFDLEFQVGARRLLISVTRGATSGYLGDITAGYQPIGELAKSTFAFGPALECRIDLRDMDSPKSLNLTHVSVMVGERSESSPWRSADEWAPGSTPLVNEVDPPRLVSDDPRYVLARRFQLPAGYVAERLFTPPAPDLTGIARSQSGVVYLEHGGLSSGISILDPSSGAVVRILDLPVAGYASVVGGPGETAFIGQRGEIWQVRPDGSYEIWAKRSNGRPKYYTSDGRLLGISHDRTRVLELFPDGSSHEVAGGFTDIYDIVASADGTIYVSDWETGNITRIDADGAKHTLAERVLFRDPLDMDIDPAGQLFLNTVVTGFVRVDTNNGTFTHFESAHTECTLHNADFVFTAPGRVLFMDPTWSQITWADLNTGASGLLVSNQGANTMAADIGPDDALYVGAWGCGTEIPAQVVRIADDGRRDVYVDGLRGRVSDLAFALDGGLYIATSGRERSVVYYVPPRGSDVVQIPDAGKYGIFTMAVHPSSGHLFTARHSGSSITEFTLDGLVTEYPLQFPKAVWDLYIDAAPDGTLYAFASEAARQQTGPVVERWLLRLDVENGSTEIVAEIDREGCCVMGNLSIDSQGLLWLLINPEFRIYRVTPDGEIMLFAQNLPIDPGAVAVDSQGDVYFTSPSGIYRIYRES